MPLTYAPYAPRVPAYAFVDGGYIRARLLEIGCAPEIDPGGPARSAASGLEVAEGTIVVSRVFYYDAVSENDPAQQAYLDKIQMLPNTFVASTGYLRRRKKRGREQKAVDVQLSVDALEAAYSRSLAAIVLVAGDLDFLPLVEAIRRAGPQVIIGAVEGHLADELRAAADRVTLFQEARMRKWNPV